MYHNRAYVGNRPADKAFINYIVKGVSPRILEPQYFVRTVDGGWFSLGWWGSRLDIDGSLYAQMLKYSNFSNLS